MGLGGRHSLPARLLRLGSLLVLVSAVGEFAIKELTKHHNEDHGEQDGHQVPVFFVVLGALLSPLLT